MQADTANVKQRILVMGAGELGLAANAKSNPINNLDTRLKE